MFTPYFMHDASAFNDPKCMALHDQLGYEGYGIYWHLVELLRFSPRLRLNLSVIPILAKRHGTSKEKMGAVVKRFGLFEIDGDEFYSPRLMSDISKATEKGRKAAEKRWGKPKQIEYPENNEHNSLSISGNTLHEHSTGIAPALGEHTTALQVDTKREENRIEDKNSIVAPRPSDQLLDREAKFKAQLALFVPTYGPQMIQQFYDYWREPNKSKSKMRWEGEKTWDISLRLKRWASNNFKSNQTPDLFPAPGKLSVREQHDMELMKKTS